MDSTQQDGMIDSSTDLSKEIRAEMEEARVKLKHDQNKIEAEMEQSRAKLRDDQTRMKQIQDEIERSTAEMKQRLADQSARLDKLERASLYSRSCRALGSIGGDLTRRILAYVYIDDRNYCYERGIKKLSQIESDLAIDFATSEDDMEGRRGRWEQIVSRLDYTTPENRDKVHRALQYLDNVQKGHAHPVRYPENSEMRPDDPRSLLPVMIDDPTIRQTVGTLIETLEFLSEVSRI